jgi:lipopolysaccharide export LptBFGC system permease protein LptF
LNTTLPPEELIQNVASRESTESYCLPSEPEPDLSLDLKEQQLDFQVENLRQELKETKDTHDLRLGYSSRIFWLVCCWLVCVAASVFMSGFNFHGFSLSDNVLIAFITSTTVNVVGLFVVVAKWMFPNSNNKKNK